jgi:hypothetical protein
MPCRTKKSSTCLHLLMHIFMIHGVDPLVEEAVNTYLFHCQAQVHGGPDSQHKFL